MVIHSITQRRNSVNIRWVDLAKGNGRILTIQDNRIFLTWIWQASGRLCQGRGQRAGFKECDMLGRLVPRPRAWVPALPLTSVGPGEVTSSSKSKGARLDDLMSPSSSKSVIVAYFVFFFPPPSHIWTELAKPIDLERKWPKPNSPPCR